MFKRIIGIAVSGLLVVAGIAPGGSAFAGSVENSGVSSTRNTRSDDTGKAGGRQMRAPGVVSQSSEQPENTDSCVPQVGKLASCLVNSSFDYPYGLSFNNAGWDDWARIDPQQGPTSPWQTVSDWSYERFGWNSTQTVNPVGAVEVRRDAESNNRYAEITESQLNTSIYQDIKTVPGATYRWSLRHTSKTRGFVDKMQVVIGAPGQEQVQNNVMRTVSNGNDSVGGPLTEIATKVTNSSPANHEGQWETYEGEYVVPKGETTTRFMFQATASPSYDSGNEVDDITFVKTRSLTYDANGGEGKLPTDIEGGQGACAVLHMPGDALTLPTAAKDADCWDSSMLTRPGMSFMGWSQRETDPVAVAADPSSAGVVSTLTMPAKDVKLYAVWKADPAELRFDANGGTGTTAAVVGVTGQAVTVPNSGFARPGYSFAGWNTQADGKGDTYAANATYRMPASGVTLYAVWKAESAKITYDANGGTGVTAATSGATGQDVELAANGFARNGYSFVGWNTQADGKGTGYAAQSSYRLPAGSSVLYAIWKAQAATAHFDTECGKVFDIQGVTDEVVTLPECSCTRAGYHFVGWSDTAVKHIAVRTIYPSGSTYRIPAGGATLWGIWDADAADVRYDANGGSGSMQASVGVTDQRIALAANTFVRSGYTFAGWNTVSDGSGQSYQSGDNVNLPAGGLWLYAQWTKKDSDPSTGGGSSASGGNAGGLTPGNGSETGNNSEGSNPSGNGQQHAGASSVPPSASGDPNSSNPRAPQTSRNRARTGGDQSHATSGLAVTGVTVSLIAAISGALLAVAGLLILFRRRLDDME